MSPRFLPATQVERLDGLLGRLMRREACPLVATRAPRFLGLLEIAFRLAEPVMRPVGHVVITLRAEADAG